MQVFDENGTFLGELLVQLGRAWPGDGSARLFARNVDGSERRLRFDLRSSHDWKRRRFFALQAPGAVVGCRHSSLVTRREEIGMSNRRNFLRQVASATAGLLVSRHGPAEGFSPFQVGAPPGKRREVSIGGRR